MKRFIRTSGLWATALMLCLGFLLIQAGAVRGYENDQSGTVEQNILTDPQYAPEESTQAAVRREYPLPYPGILPDHPLFFVKRIRDSLVEMLIADPIRKGEYYVLQSDKWLNTALFLNEKEGRPLMLESMRTALKFQEKAVGVLERAKESGKAIPASITDRLERSNMEHQDILKRFVDGGEDYQGSEMVQISDVLRELPTRIDALK